MVEVTTKPTAVVMAEMTEGSGMMRVDVTIIQTRGANGVAMRGVSAMIGGGKGGREMEV